MVASAAAQTLKGIVAANAPLAHAVVVLRDHNGAERTTTTDAGGHYTLDASGLTPPLALSAAEYGNSNCRRNNSPRAVCVSALVLAITEGANTANINPLSDVVTSLVANALGFPGPQQLSDTARTPEVPPQVYANALATFHAGFDSAMADVVMQDVAKYNPVTTPLDADHTGLFALIQVINHTRGYDNNSGESAATVITDMGWRPVVKPFGPDANEPLQFERSRRELESIMAAPLRIFIVGDSTAATYERQRLPRMGWGQVFEDVFLSTSGVKVVNGARAGRSSRDFHEGGWYRQMAHFIRPGDYVFIAHGHNDQNCNAMRPIRGAADVANLCTYPNEASGARQFPAGQPQLSFQTSLERYISDVRSKGGTPVLLTPTTRFLNANRRQAYKDGDVRPVISQHLTRQNSLNGYAFVGDYARTVKDTARGNAVPLIDLEAKTIHFANAHSHDWQDYWLVVTDTQRYPWYASQKEGTPETPDTTHFQERGARAVADLVAQGIREVADLKPLALLLK
jgi:lysophospholipase L1-like esterase